MQIPLCWLPSSCEAKGEALSVGHKEALNKRLVTNVRQEHRSRGSVQGVRKVEDIGSRGSDTGGGGW